MVSKQSSAGRRAVATAFAATCAAASLAGAGLAPAGAGAYNRHPKNCPAVGKPDVGHINAKISIKTKTPKVGNDPIRVTATSGGKPISGGKVHYLFLWNNQIVSCQPVAPPEKPYFVRGSFHDVLIFPPDAVLAKPFLVIRVVIEWHGQRKNADVSVVVHK